MPKLFAQDILKKEDLDNDFPVVKLDPEHELTSALDIPELPAAIDEDLLEEVLWSAPARPFRKKDRSFYTTVAILIVLISLIAFLAGEMLLIGALFALGFLVYVLNFIPPEMIDYKISENGITVGNHFYQWQDLDSFWFCEKDNFQLLNVLTRLKFPKIILLVLNEGDEEKIRKIASKYIPFHEIAPRSLMDKWSENLQKYFPLENPKK